MPDGTDYLMRPVLHHLCGYESLVDGTLSLTDVARMNDAVSVMLENNIRLRSK